MTGELVDGAVDEVDQDLRGGSIIESGGILGRPALMVAGAAGVSEPGDHAALGLAVGAVVAWGVTGATGSLLMAMATAGLLVALTAVSTFTALAVPRSTMSTRVLAGVAAAVVAAVFVVTIDRAWSWMLPTVLLAVGMKAPRSRRVRLTALIVSTLMLLAAWTLALL